MQTGKERCNEFTGQKNTTNPFSNEPIMIYSRGIEPNSEEHLYDDFQKEIKRGKNPNGGTGFLMRRKNKLKKKKR